MKKLLAALRTRLDTPTDSLKHTLLAVLAGGCLMGLASLYLSAGRYGIFMFAWYFLRPKVLLLNLLPFLALALLFFGLTNRAWLSYLLTGLACIAYSFPQFWKLMGRNDPLFAEDLLIVAEAVQMSKQYVQLSWQVVLTVALVGFGTWVFFKVFRGRFTRVPARLALPLAVVALCACLYPTVYTSAKVYNSMKVFPYINQWFETNKYISRGGIYPFIYSIQTALPNEPEGYDEAAAAAAIAAYETDDIPEDKKVSVICVMYEAFTDLTECTDTITGADPYEAFHALQAESYHGTLVTNVFAGGTIDTERCVLTGFNALTNFRRPSWSYARYFADQGYTLNGAHAGYAAFYNRRNVNENLGIADYRFIEGYYDSLFPDQIPTDAQLLPDITARCLEQMADGPVFSFNVTYQNHGPYPTDTANFEQPYVPQGDLSDGDYHIINNYLWGVEDTGKQMTAMAEQFRHSEEPVVLLFFGDHKPWLGEQSATYRAMNIDIFSQNDESFYTYYSTQYLIWANDAAKAVLGTDMVGQAPTVSPCYLMNVLFDACGWEGPSYMKLTGEAMAAMPILHATNRMQVEGAMVEEADLSDENRRLLQTLRCAQFYLAQDAAARLP